MHVHDDTTEHEIEYRKENRGKPHQITEKKLEERFEILKM